MYKKGEIFELTVVGSSTTSEAFIIIICVLKGEDCKRNFKWPSAAGKYIWIIRNKLFQPSRNDNIDQIKVSDIVIFAWRVTWNYTVTVPLTNVFRILLSRLNLWAFPLISITKREGLCRISTVYLFSSWVVCVFVSY